ncbi:MAG: dihydroorotate dehydrogenase electron transfer subunit [Acidaminococcaceae bacterium]|nr:dihydroorotate dehydrogenase electron transfer subunit [Acidaminococcaceae bacterium]
MKRIVNAKIYKNIQLNSTVKLMEVIAPEIAAEAVPGQFVNVRVTKGITPLLRRPLGVADVCVPRGSVTLIYRVLGEATKILADLQKDDSISLVGPLGNGFDITAKRPLIVGGGCGLAPLLMLAKFGFGNGRADLLIGGRNQEEVAYWQKLYQGNVQNIYTTTDDGSMGTKGTVMAELEGLLQKDYDCVYVCGPVLMMKAVAKASLDANKKCQVSLERYMACGLGACLSCSCEGIGKRLKVCQDGPVFWAQEVGEW